jgi:hypothetical protein
MESHEDPDAEPWQVAQYEKLKDEIQGRSQAQLAILTLNVTIIGTTLGFILGAADSDLGHLTGDRLPLGLVLPIICPLLGMMWLDHDANIRSIGGYVRKELWPSDLTTYETRARKREESYVDRIAMLGLPTYLMFGGIPLAALVALGSLVPPLVWIAAAFCTGYFSIAWLRCVFLPVFESRHDSDIGSAKSLEKTGSAEQEKLETPNEVVTAAKTRSTVRGAPRR